MTIMITATKITLTTTTLMTEDGLKEDDTVRHLVVAAVTAQ
jgi:hypothetical protein